MDQAEPSLTPQVLENAARRIEASIVPAMERIYGHGEPTFPPDFRPGLKRIEKVVSFYDYDACGISVLAPLAARGDGAALRLIRILRRNMEHYMETIHGRDVPEFGTWNVPLRRSLLHVALAWPFLRGALGAEDREGFPDIVRRQAPLAIEHCRGFLPGRKDLHLAGVNNHTAIFMQGVWHCGRAFDRPGWTDLAREFAERYLASGHPDGYFEEHTNAEREGGPSPVYTPLTAGSLYDVLGGRERPREPFLKAGAFFRSFLDADRRLIPLADERTNMDGPAGVYGLAVHSLSAEGRAFIAETLESLDCDALSPEALAVARHEIGLMRTGPCAAPEYRGDGAARLGLPLGILRGHGFTAGLSALRALNREIAADNDYALDRQAMVHLSREGPGTIVSAVKSKRDPRFSTFRIGDDAYTVRTGSLEMGAGGASAALFYGLFRATIRWELSPRPRLILAADTDREVETTLCVPDPSWIRCVVPFERVLLKVFSPYTKGNLGEEVPAVRFHWRRELRMEFARMRG